MEAFTSRTETQTDRQLRDLSSSVFIEFLRGSCSWGTSNRDICFMQPFSERFYVEAETETVLRGSVSTLTTPSSSACNRTVLRQSDSLNLEEEELPPLKTDDHSQSADITSRLHQLPAANQQS